MASLARFIATAWPGSKGLGSDHATPGLCRALASWKLREAVASLARFIATAGAASRKNFEGIRSEGHSYASRDIDPFHNRPRSWCSFFTNTNLYYLLPTGILFETPF